MMVAWTKNNDQKKSVVQRLAQKNKLPPNNADKHGARLPTLSELIIGQCKEVFC